VFGSILTADQVAAMHAQGKPLVDAGSTQSPGLYILDGRFAIASGTSGTRLVLNNTSLAIGDGVGYKSGAGVWTGIDTDGAAKLFVGSSSGAHMDYDGTSLYLRASSSTYLKADGSLLEFYSSGYRRLLINSSGSVVVGRSDAERVLISAHGVSLYSGGNRTGWWQTDGDLFLGSNVENPATTHACFFAASQWYNNEQFAAGDILLGDNSSGKANIVFDYDQAALWFRAGSRQMRLNAFGLQLEVPSSGSDIGIVWRRNSFSIDEAYIKWERGNNLLRIVTGNTTDASYKPIVFEQYKSGPVSQIPLYISGSRRTVGVFSTNPQAATLYVSNPGDVNPALWVNQCSGCGAAIRIQTTGEYDKILAFNFNCDTYSGAGYRALRVWVEGIGSRWLRLYDST
jgi:hypothetical protein